MHNKNHNTETISQSCPVIALVQHHPSNIGQYAIMDISQNVSFRDVTRRGVHILILIKFYVLGFLPNHAAAINFGNCTYGLGT